MHSTWLGFKGPVWKVEEQWAPPFENRSAIEFDRAGNRVGVPKPIVEIQQTANGGRLERKSVFGYDAWSMDGLNGVSFYTRGAAVAETTFDAQGAPIQTVLRNARNEAASIIRYACDAMHRIVEAGQMDPAPPVLLGVIGPEVETRVTFRYDDADRVVEQTTSIGGTLNSRTLSAYNEHGDLKHFESDSGETYDIDYEYDAQGNWTHKAVRHPQATIEGRREITYYALAG